MVENMTTAAKPAKRLVVFLGLAMLCGAAVPGPAGPETASTNSACWTGVDKVKHAAKDAMAEGKSAIREGVEKTDAAVTNVVHQIGVGAHKATGVATNVVAHVKVAVTDTVAEVKAAVKGATR